MEIEFYRISHDPIHGSYLVLAVSDKLQTIHRSRDGNFIIFKTWVEDNELCRTMIYLSYENHSSYLEKLPELENMRDYEDYKDMIIKKFTKNI